MEVAPCPTKVGQCAQWLRGVLTDGVRPLNQLRAEAEGLGFEAGVFYRAAKRAGHPASAQDGRKTKVTLGRDAVEDAVKAGRRTAYEVAETIGLKADTVRRRLKELALDGKVTAVTTKTDKGFVTLFQPAGTS